MHFLKTADKRNTKFHMRVILILKRKLVLLTWYKYRSDVYKQVTTDQEPISYLSCRKMKFIISYSKILQENFTTAQTQRLFSQYLQIRISWTYPCKLFWSSAIWKKFRSKTVRSEISTERELKAIWNDKLEHQNVAFFRRVREDLKAVECQQ